jgi:hypothetical protein
MSHRACWHYSHVRLQAKRKALEALSSSSQKDCETSRQALEKLASGPSEPAKGRGSEGSYGTKRGTNASAEPVPPLQVIERDGGREGIRTPNPLLAKQA